MDLQNLKRWQWMVISLLVGLVLSYLYSSWDRSARLPSTSAGDLQNILLRQERRAEGNPPMVKNIRLHPPQIDPNGNEVWYLTVDKLLINRGGYVPHEVNSAAPFRVLRPNGTELRPNEELPNIRAYLDAVAAANEGLDYQYLWWREGAWTYTIWMSGAFVVIGLIWPTVLNRMVRAGYGRPQQESDYDLSRYGKGGAEPGAQAADPEFDEAELDAVTKAYEERIDSEELSVEPDDAADEPEPIRTLDAQAMDDTPAPVKTQEEIDKEFAGEFYPVARTTHRKKDE